MERLETRRALAGRLGVLGLLAALAGVGLGAGLVVGCGNPAVDVRIAALGDEVEGVEPSAFHRPGQPCVLCHDIYEGAEPRMSVGGTIYGVSGLAVEEAIPAEGVIVTLTDSEGVSRSKTTNCVGNFFFTRDEWIPAFPLRAELEYPLPLAAPVAEGETAPTKRVVMGTRISRDGSCASCHTRTPPNQGSPGWVFCSEEQTSPPFEPPDKSCAGVP